MITLIRKLIHDTVILLAPKWLRKRLMSCQDIAQILANKEELSTARSIMLKMHLLICQCCTNYSKQLDLIEGGAKKIQAPELTDEQRKALESAKNDLLQKIKSS